MWNAPSVCLREKSFYKIITLYIGWASAAQSRNVGSEPTWLWVMDQHTRFGAISWGYFIECHLCETIVAANVVGRTGVRGTDEEIPESYVISEMPAMSTGILGLPEAIDYSDDAGEWSRTISQFGFGQPRL
ncbi:MAG: hypothetical protein ACR2JB_25795 [Bryobacteraceae bacterium]